MLEMKTNRENSVVPAVQTPNTQRQEAYVPEKVLFPQKPSTLENTANKQDLLSGFSFGFEDKDPMEISMSLTHFNMWIRNCDGV